MPPIRSGSIAPLQQFRAPATFKESSILQFPGVARTEDNGWRSRGNSLGRDLDKSMQDRSIKQAYAAYRFNPMAHRLIEMKKNFVLGNGITLTSADPATAAIIQAWWTNPYNAWPRKIEQRMRDLYIYGEWLHRPITSKEGVVYIRDVQTSSIEDVIADTYNHSEVETVILARTIGPDGAEHKSVKVPTIRRRLNELTVELDPAYTGDFFFVGINQTTDSLRGVSELFPLLDYIDSYDELVFSRVEKVSNMAHVWWDLTLQGMTEVEMRNYLAAETNVPPRPGTVWAHNESAQLKAVTADLKADDHEKDVSMIKSLIVSSDGWPGTWWDDPGSAGRAVGAEMAEPALKNIIALQSFARQIIELEMEYVLYMAESRGSYVRPEAVAGQPLYAISFARPSARDFQRVGPALARLSSFLKDARTLNVLTQEEVRQIIVSQIHQLNLSDQPITLELPYTLEQVQTEKDQAALDQAQAAAKAAQDAAEAPATTGVTTPAQQSKSAKSKSGDDQPQ